MTDRGVKLATLFSVSHSEMSTHGKTPFDRKLSSAGTDSEQPPDAALSTKLHHFRLRSNHTMYSLEQLGAYFARIALPPDLLASPLLKTPDLARTREHGLPFVAALMRHHLAAIPFENLSLHYSPHRYVPLDMDEVYKRMVEQGTGRGGQCMEMNGLFGNVLRSLGFEVMSTAARVNTACQDAARHPGYKGPSYNGW